MTMITGSSVLAWLPADRGQHLEAAHARHLDVEQHEVETPIAQQGQRVAAGGCRGDEEAALLEEARQRVAVDSLSSTTSSDAARLFTRSVSSSAFIDSIPGRPRKT